jgi:hypothetical protein
VDAGIQGVESKGLLDYLTRGEMSNYWMMLSMIARILQSEVNAICQSRRLRRITLTEVWIILDMMQKPNSE